MARRWIPFAFVAVAIAACSVPPSLGVDSDSNADPGIRQLASEGTTCADGGAGTVVGKINEKYLALGGCDGFLGLPLGDEQKTPDGIGRYSVFTNGSIYWHPRAGAFEVHGAIRGAWANEHWEAGPLGYPTSDEHDIPGGRQNDFQYGNITWVDGKTDVHVSFTETQGQATYYYYSSGGSCGLKPPPNNFIAALNDEQYTKANCGRCAMVTGPKGSVKVLLLDKCPGCGWGDLDLSQQAFEQIASTSAGRVKIGWHFVDCD